MSKKIIIAIIIIAIILMPVTYKITGNIISNNIAKQEIENEYFEMNTLESQLNETGDDINDTQNFSRSG